MSAPDELVPFVREALRLGQDRAAITDALRQAGWTEEQTDVALGAFADVAFPIPVPRPKPYLSAKEAFWYLVLFTTLYLSAINLGTLLFHLIDLALPDPTDTPYAVSSAKQSIRWAIAILIVAFPLFVFMNRLVSHALRRDPAKRASKVRKWLTYLTLFVAVCVLLGDGSTLIYNLLSGDLTSRFLLKALTVAIVAGSVFWYYFRDLRRDDDDT
jgi:hypothetical protein